MTREERVAAAQRLRAEGLVYREIAEILGCPISTINEDVRDPDRSRARARRNSYRGKCRGCGSPTDGSRGTNGVVSRLCISCYRAWKYDNRYWTRERIVAWIRQYVADHGRPPPATVQVVSVDNGGPGFSTKTIRREFGPQGWGRAVRAAGFEPYFDVPGSGVRLGDQHPLVVETLKLYGEGYTLQEIADRHSVTTGAVADRLTRRGVKMRTALESRRLRQKREAG